MSSVLYGRLTTRRIDERLQGIDGGSDDDKKKWLDALASLVPAEALHDVHHTDSALVGAQPSEQHAEQCSTGNG